MASLSLVRLLVLCLLCVTSLAEKRRYLSVSMDDLMSSSKAHLDCPPSKKSGTDHESSSQNCPHLSWSSRKKNKVTDKGQNLRSRNDTKHSD
ncbi:unnamed protein product [Urochloa humidicola]